MGTYELDASHTTIEFVTRHLMVAKVRGRFGAFSGTITVPEDAAAATVDVTIDAESIDTRDAQRDTHLRSADFLDVEHFPSLRFSARGARSAGDRRWQLDGELTIRDLTRPVTLDFAFNGSATSPYGQAVAFFTASTEIDREDFGITWNQALETGGVLVSKQVRIELEIEAIRAT